MKKRELERYTYVYGDKTILDGPVKSFDGHIHFNGDASLFPQFGVRTSTRLDLYSRGYEDPWKAVERVAPLLTRRDALRLGVKLREVRLDNELLLRKIGHAQMLRKGEKLGIDYYAVTSHDYDAYDETARIRDLLEVNIGLIRGREVTARPHFDSNPAHKGKHLIALDATEMPPYGLSVTDTIKFIQNHGGLAILAHFGTGKDSFTLDELKALINAGVQPDAIEIYTGAMARVDKSRAAMWGRAASKIPALDRKVAPAGANARARADYEEHFKENLGFSVGSDAHEPRHAAEAIGVFPAHMDPKEAIRQGRVVAMRRKLAISTLKEVRNGGRLSRRLEEMRQEGIVFDIHTREQVLQKD